MVSEATSKTEQLDGLKYLSSTHRALHEKRQKYEWKIVFAILSFDVLSVSFFYTDKTTIDGHCSLIPIVIICAFTMLIISFIILRGLHKANEVNKQIAVYAEENINNLVSDNPISSKTLNDIVVETQNNFCLIDNLWSFCTQYLSIILFTALATLFIINAF